ncbi:MAG: hypothetical protein UU72_C0009G0001, partial [candidate division WWE3 bacterium GW2011_GWB1_41_6]
RFRSDDPHSEGGFSKIKLGYIFGKSTVAEKTINYLDNTSAMVRYLEVALFQSSAFLFSSNFDIIQ